MLKFLRKYQLILLAVGGSLLMVVFLLQPVLQQLTPDPRKRTVARIGETKVTLGEQTRASIELDMLERFLPQIPAVLRLDEEERTYHWLLLKHEAERLGVLGVQQDGADWIAELAEVLAQQEMRRMQQQGQQVTPDMVEEIYDQAGAFLEQRKTNLLRSNSLNEAVFNEVLSKARGVMRLRQLYEGAPRLSRQRAVRAYERLGEAVLIDQLVLGPDLLMDEVPEPTETELEAQLAAYSDLRPGESRGDGEDSYGFGYLLPARVKLEWLELAPGAIAEVVTADPVQVRRRWQEQGGEGSFSEAREEIENEVKRERVQQILSDADEVIRGEILSATRGLEREGIYRAVPDGWTAPDLERIAGDVVEAVRDRHGVRIPRPVVNRRTDRWLTASELGSLPGVGRAVYRVGTQQKRVGEIPSMVRDIGDDTTVAVQVGLPIVDPPAVNPQTGARYYVTVLDAVGESAPSSVDEIRERLIEDVKSLKAYNEHLSRLDVYRETARRDGLEGLAAMFAGDDGESPVQVRDNIFVYENRLGFASFQSFPDRRADSEGFREAVFEAAEGLDPLAEPDSLPLDEAVVGVGVPSSRVVAFGRVRAFKPATQEQYRAQQSGVVANTKNELLGATPETDPLRLGAMTERLGFEVLGEEEENEDSEGTAQG